MCKFYLLNPFKKVVMESFFHKQLNFSNATSVIPREAKFLLPVPELLNGKLVDKMVASYYNSALAAHRDGKGVVVFEGITALQADEIRKEIAKSFPNKSVNNLSPSETINVINYIRSDFKPSKITVEDRQSLSGKLSPVGREAGATPYGLFRSTKDIYQTILLPGKGEYHGTNGKIERFESGLVILKNSDGIRSVNPDWFQAAYMRTDGTKIQAIDLPKQTSQILNGTAQQVIREEISELYRNGVVKTHGRSDVPFASFVTEERLHKLIYLDGNGRVKMSVDAVNMLPIENQHVMRQLVAGLAQIGLQNNIIDQYPHEMMTRYGITAINNGNRPSVYYVSGASVDEDYGIRKTRINSTNEGLGDNHILGQPIGSNGQLNRSKPLTNNRPLSIDERMDNTGWNRFPEAEGRQAVFDKGNGRSTLEEIHISRVRRGGGVIIGTIVAGVAAATAGVTALIAGATPAEAATNAANAAADSVPILGAVNAARQDRIAEAKQRALDDLTFGIHGEIARLLQRYFNGRGDNAPEKDRIDPSMGETLVTAASGLVMIGVNVARDTYHASVGTSNSATPSQPPVGLNQSKIDAAKNAAKANSAKLTSANEPPRAIPNNTDALGNVLSM